MSTKSPSFPDIHKKRSSNLPKHYDLSRSSNKQETTHRNILALGNAIHEKSLQEFEAEKLQAVKEAEESVWTQAEMIKEKAVEKAVKQLQLRHDRVMKQTMAEHEKKAVAALLNMERELKTNHATEVSLLKSEASATKSEALKAMESKLLKEKYDEVAAARDEERRIASANAEEAASIEKAKLDAVKEQAELDKRQAINDVIAARDVQEKRAIAEACAKIEEEGAQRAFNLQQMYEKRVSDLEVMIKESKADVMKLYGQIDRMREKHQETVEELLETRKEYQAFIDKSDTFKHGDAAFVMAPARTVHPEKIPNK